MNDFKKLLAGGTLLFMAVMMARGNDGVAKLPRTVVVFGDSITEGNMLPTEQKELLWVRVVEEQSQGKLRMINEGKGGRPTASLPEFAQMLKRQPQADALVIALGTNDSRDITESCVPKAVANIRTMVEEARKTYGAIPIVIVGPPNIRQDALGPTRSIGDKREAKIRELGSAYEKLAAETGCVFVSLNGVVPAESLAKDGVHPDGEGNKAIAATMLPKLLLLYLEK